MAAQAPLLAFTDKPPPEHLMKEGIIDEDIDDISEERRGETTSGFRLQLSVQEQADLPDSLMLLIFFELCLLAMRRVLYVYRNI